VPKLKPPSCSNWQHNFHPLNNNITTLFLLESFISNDRHERSRLSSAALLDSITS